MTPKLRVVVTGGNGFIGRCLVKALQEAGHEVIGLARGAGSRAWEVRVDLMDGEAVTAAARGIGTVDAVVHLAALAHGQRPPAGETCLSVNLKLTENILSAFRARAAHWVLFSSVAVYGEAGRPQPVGLDARLRPATEYGRSKKLCEERWLGALADADVLRLAPVFDKEHLRDVGKRVFVPGTRIRMRMQPAPLYSLCRVETAVAGVLVLLARGPAGRQLHHGVDPEPYAQDCILDWFSGPTIPVPRRGLAPLRWLLGAVPGDRGYAVRCLFHKLFESNLYTPGSLRLAEGAALT